MDSTGGLDLLPWHSVKSGQGFTFGTLEVYLCVFCIYVCVLDIETEDIFGK